MAEEHRGYKLKQIAITIYLTLVFLGLILGPSSWYMNYSFVSEYNAFAKDAIEVKGTVYKRWKKIKGRSSNCYISVRYSIRPYEVTLASKVKVLHALEVTKGDEVTVLYHPGNPKDEIRIKGETDWKNLPPIRKPYVGIVYTLFAYVSLIYFLIRGYRKKRQSLKTNV